MKITNVRHGLGSGGYRCLTFDIDGRSAMAFSEQKKGVCDAGYLSVSFQDDKPSHLPYVTISKKIGNMTAEAGGTNLIYSPWLNQKMTEMCDQEVVEDNYLIGDAPDEKP